MTGEASWESPLATYPGSFAGLIDRRIGFTFCETIKEIIASDSLIGQRMTAHSQLSAQTAKGSQRVIRLPRVRAPNGRSQAPSA